MKMFRKMKAGIKLLARLEPVAEYMTDSCPKCSGKVVLWFDHLGKHRPYYPTHEGCLTCPWRKPFYLIEEEAGVIPTSHPQCRCASISIE